MKLKDKIIFAFLYIVMIAIFTFTLIDEHKYATIQKYELTIVTEVFSESKNIKGDYKIICDSGKEYLLAKTNNYAFKRLEILKGKNISKQLHKHKHETWHIIEGIGTAIIAGRVKIVKPGMTIVIPPGMIHQVRADSEKLVIIEASTTELEDIVRFDRSFPCI